ncbi:hypothetical protein PWT90_03435 [Aphanocladium album]|nr:hypothetical protein PWT90_03435 [Aphanocladium album]
MIDSCEPTYPFSAGALQCMAKQLGVCASTPAEPLVPGPEGDGRVDPAPPLPKSATANALQRRSTSSTVEYTRLPTELEIQRITTALSRASLSGSSKPRLVVSYAPASAQASGSALAAAAQALPCTANRWPVECIIQRRRDIDHQFAIRYHDQNPTATSPAGSIREIRCKIVYDPDDDACFLCNVGDWPFAVGPLKSNTLVDLQPKEGCARLKPGFWTIYARVGARGRAYWETLAHLHLLQRRFHLAIHGDEATSSRKRHLSFNDDLAVEKRAKTDSGQARIASHRYLASFDGCTLRGASLNPSTTLAHLQTGQAALVRAVASAQQSDSSSYILRQTGAIAQNDSTIVFSCVHSRVKGQVVAKVLRNRQRSPQLEDTKSSAASLRIRSTMWKNEREILRKLKHDNIVKLLSYDARFLVLYLELLPKSLVVGERASFSRDANISILKGIASALACLAQQGFRHNDVKPGNIAWSPRRGAVLLDFGLADRDGHTLGGSAWYLPPEYYLHTWLIPLPDRRDNNWHIREARINPYGKDGERMQRWLNLVSAERDKLNRSRGSQLRKLSEN